MIRRMSIARKWINITLERNRVGGVITDPASHTTRHAGPHRAVHTFANDR